MVLAPGEYQILTGNSLDEMKRMDSESVSCVITDPPYVGFGFARDARAYHQKFVSYLNEMVRICVGDEKRIAISQPPNAKMQVLNETFQATCFLKISDAFADQRGEDAFFLLRNPISKTPNEAETWTNIPSTIHPNDRDVNKMAVLVNMMTSEGDTVLDPFCGSGAIGIASILLGRNYVGVELEVDRAEDARARLAYVVENFDEFV